MSITFKSVNDRIYDIFTDEEVNRVLGESNVSVDISTKNGDRYITIDFCNASNFINKLSYTQKGQLIAADVEVITNDIYLFDPEEIRSGLIDENAVIWLLFSYIQIYRNIDQIQQFYTVSLGRKRKFIVTKPRLGYLLYNIQTSEENYGNIYKVFYSSYEFSVVSSLTKLSTNISTNLDLTKSYCNNPNVITNYVKSGNYYFELYKVADLLKVFVFTSCTWLTSECVELPKLALKHTVCYRQIRISDSNYKPFCTDANNLVSTSYISRKSELVKDLEINDCIKFSIQLIEPAFDSHLVMAKVISNKLNDNEEEIKYLILRNSELKEYENKIYII